MSIASAKRHGAVNAALLRPSGQRFMPTSKMMAMEQRRFRLNKNRHRATLERCRTTVRAPVRKGPRLGLDIGTSANLREHRIDAGIIALRVPAPDREREDEGGEADTCRVSTRSQRHAAAIRLS